MGLLLAGMIFVLTQSLIALYYQYFAYKIDFYIIDMLFKRYLNSLASLPVTYVSSQSS